MQSYVYVWFLKHSKATIILSLHTTGLRHVSCFNTQSNDKYLRSTLNKKVNNKLEYDQMLLEIPIVSKLIKLYTNSKCFGLDRSLFESFGWL